MNERIKVLRKTLKLSQAEFASRLGITQPSVSSMESGSTAPANSTIVAICNTFGCDEVWLRTGEGEMFRTVPEDEELAALMGAIIAEGNPDKIRLAHVLLDLLDEGWPLIKERLKKHRENAGK